MSDVPLAFAALPHRPILPLVRAKRRSPLRTLATFALLVVLTSIIILYLIFTDPARVRQLATRFLTQQVGGHVSIGHATLSIFDGLRLDGLRISTVENGKQTPLFEAKSLQVHFDLKALLAGQIAAEQVLALEPHVYLVEDVDKKQWSFQRLERPTAPPGPGGKPAPTKATELPEVLVRDARIDYAQIIHGVRSEVGTLNFEGQLAPDDQDLYRFRMQSRGGESATFPIAEGWVKPDGSRLGLVVRDVEFVDEIKTILPAVVRRFWEEHHLAGRMAQTRVNYYRKPDGKAGFTVETVLDSVKLTLPPSAWMDAEDNDRVHRWKSACEVMASPVMGGSPVTAAIANAMTPDGLQFDQVDGKFIFTDEKIKIDQLVARFENNRFRVTGNLDGYDPGAAMDVRVESLKSQNIVIPESPAYIASMPWPVQEIYYRFRPQGACSFWFHAHRATGQRKPTLDGEVAIKDASFTFDRVPYTLQHGNGTLRLTTDPQTGEQAMEIVNVRGHGFDGSANEKATVGITGVIKPLDDLAGVKVRVTGTNIKSEPRLIKALPPQTRAAVEALDPQHTGKLPSFDSDFVIDVERPVGYRKPTMTTTSLSITHAAGVIGAFPYPVNDASAKLTIFEDHLELQQLQMNKGDASVELSGLVNWQHHNPTSGEPLIQPDLHVIARGVPVDDELLMALPADKRVWLQKSNLHGRLDVEGSITSPVPTTEETALDLGVVLHDGSMQMPGAKLPLTDIAAQGRLTADGMTLTSFAGKCEKADLAGTGTVRWTKQNPSATAAIRVTGLSIDDALLSAVPDATRRQIESLQAKGTVDADLDYASAEKVDYRLALRPHELEMTPSFFPVPFTNVRGEVIVEPGQVRLLNVSALHGKALTTVKGAIDRSTSIARLSLAGRDWVIDDSTRRALPGGLRDFANSIHLAGGLAFDCPAVQISLDSNASSSAPPDTFDASVWLQKASLEIGPSMSDVNGMIKLAGSVQGQALKSLSGEMNIDQVNIAGRQVTRLTADVRKPIDRDVLQVSKIDARLAGGVVAGRIETTLDKRDPRYAVSLQIRDAKVGELTGEAEAIDGRLTGSVTMEGRWDDSGQRRGHGDVSVEGRDMYRVPVVFGLMQIANLSLPNDAPLHRAGLRYSLDGQKMVLEQIDLRSTNSAMQGDGSIDFGTKVVQLTLSLADSPADSVPVFGMLFKTARQDLLQIKVRGTLQAPTINAQAFNTFSTTVDEVMKGKQ